MWLRSLSLLLLVTSATSAQRPSRSRLVEARVMAAKTTVWTGAVDGDWDEATVGNWSNGVPAYIASPGPYDTVYISPTATNPMTTNLDRSGDGAGAGLHLALFDVHESYAGDIGASGSELKLTASKIIHRGQGTMYLIGKSGTDEANVVRTIIDSQAGAVIGNVAATTLTRVELLAGNIDLTATEAIVAIDIGRSDLWSVPLDVAIDGAGAIGAIQMIGGRVSHNCTGITSRLVLAGGEFTYDSTGADVLTSAWVTGGAFFFDGAGQINQYLYLMGGTFDTTRTVGTKVVSFVHRWPGANYIVNDDFISSETEYVIGEN